MIKLTKLAEPEVLTENGADWLKALQDRIEAGEIPTDAEKARYRHPQIKARLREETHGKCAYCESFILHVAFGDIEHITPKSTALDQTFRWENLTLACDVCNTNKGTVANLIDPYDDDMASSFMFIGPMIIGNAKHDRAVNTEKKLRLNRIELVERRSERLKVIADRILLIAHVKNQQLKETLAKDLETNEIADDREFAAFVRSFIYIVLPTIA